MLAAQPPENAFFEFFLRRLSTCPTPGVPCMPRRWRPQPPAHPDRLHSTGSSAGRTRTRAGQVPGQTAHNRPRTGTHARTLHRSALDTRQAARGRSWRCRGLVGLYDASETEQKRTRQNLKNKYAKKRKYLLTFTQESV